MVAGTMAPAAAALMLLLAASRAAGQAGPPMGPPGAPAQPPPCPPGCGACEPLTPQELAAWQAERADFKGIQQSVKAAGGPGALSPEQRAVFRADKAEFEAAHAARFGPTVLPTGAPATPLATPAVAAATPAGGRRLKATVPAATTAAAPAVGAGPAMAAPGAGPAMGPASGPMGGRFGGPLAGLAAGGPMGPMGANFTLRPRMEKRPPMRCTACVDKAAYVLLDGRCYCADGYGWPAPPAPGTAPAGPPTCQKCPAGTVSAPIPDKATAQLYMGHPHKPNHAGAAQAARRRPVGRHLLATAPGTKQTYRWGSYCVAPGAAGAAAPGAVVAAPVAAKPAAMAAPAAAAAPAAPAKP